MSDITIVTAFFDIGRGEWTPDKGLPHYLQRTNDTYFERFSHMAKLENHMVVFTSEKFGPKIHELREGRSTHVISIDFDNEYEDIRKRIKDVQRNFQFQNMINPNQVKNPEYWNADYVLVNMLKSHFVRMAIQHNLIQTEMAAWLDFGYCRDKSTLNGITKWQYNFDKEKIHFFHIKDYVEGTYISEIIANNDVHITGPCIVAHKDKWPQLEFLVNHSVNELLKNDLIDDDQTLLLMSYLSKPEMFELHKVSPDDWFIVFRDYNENTNQ